MTDFFKQMIQRTFSEFYTEGDIAMRNQRSFKKEVDAVCQDREFTDQLSIDNPELVNEDAKHPYSLRGMLTRSLVVITVFEEIFRRKNIAEVALSQQKKSLLAKLKKRFNAFKKKQAQLQQQFELNKEQARQSMNAEMAAQQRRIEAMLQQYNQLAEQYSGLIEQLESVASQIEVLEMEQVALHESIWDSIVEFQPVISTAREELSRVLPPESRLLINLARIENEKFKKDMTSEELLDLKQSQLQQIMALQTTSADELKDNPQAQAVLDKLIADVQVEISKDQIHRERDAALRTQLSTLRAEEARLSTEAQHVLSELAKAHKAIEQDPEACKALVLPESFNQIADVGAPDAPQTATPTTVTRKKDASTMPTAGPRKSALPSRRAASTATAAAVAQPQTQAASSSDLQQAMMAQMRTAAEQHSAATPEVNPQRVADVLISNDVEPPIAQAMAEDLAPQLAADSEAGQLSVALIENQVVTAATEHGAEIAPEQCDAISTELYSLVQIKQALMAALEEHGVELDDGQNISDVIHAIHEKICESGEINDECEFEIIQSLEDLELENDEIYDDLFDSLKEKIESESQATLTNSIK